MHKLIKLDQESEFNEEIRCIKSKTVLPSNSSIKSLDPFLDSEVILRVGGRLQRARISKDQKHPILLPRRSALTKLIVMNEHCNALHAGAQLILTQLQKRYWIPCGRYVVRRITKGCITCFRHQAAIAEQMMGNLPSARVNPSRAFLYTGVDYTGPFYLKPFRSRSKILCKAYIALFIYFATRAIHLEIVSDMTTEAFIAALKRFIARRGKPAEIFSDCGTNFVGASKELENMLKLVKTAEHNEMIGNHLSSQGIKWKFNPPSAPHFGSLWEAGVKSVKYHLRRIVGETKLDFEEMYTLSIQIEACLNSRPLTALSSDPYDLNALTPGHFLTGDALLALPEPAITIIQMNRLSRWQYVQQLVQHFWRRWSSEYLSRLQQRPKWWTKRENLKIGDLVLLRDNLLPPLKWKLGRIIQVHPGEDQLVRSVTVRTAIGEYKRPIVKLPPLPIDYDK